MRTLRIGAVAVLVFALAGAIIWQWAQVRRLAAENTVLWEQFAQAVPAREKHEPAPTAPSPSQDLDQPHFRELLRLRGEVGVLRRQLAEVAKPHMTGSLPAQQPPDLGAERARLQEQLQKVESARQKVDRLSATLNVPQGASRMSSTEGLEDATLKHYSTYFEAKKELEEAESAAVEMRLVIVRQQEDGPDTPATPPPSQ
jgi:hypothetical protein